MIWSPDPTQWRVMCVWSGSDQCSSSADPNILNAIYNSEALNDVFINNFQKDPTLTWQYFGSSTGFFRIYPGEVPSKVPQDLPWIRLLKKVPKRCSSTMISTPVQVTSTSCVERFSPRSSLKGLHSSPVSNTSRSSAL